MEKLAGKFNEMPALPSVRFSARRECVSPRLREQRDPELRIYEKGRDGEIHPADTAFGRTAKKFGKGIPLISNWDSESMNYGL